MESSRVVRTLFALCYLIAPILLVLSTLLWSGQGTGAIGGVLIMYSFTLWIGVFLGFHELVRDRFPRFAPIALAVAILGCVAGTNFGVEGIVEEGLGIADLTEAIMSDAGGAVANAMVFAFFLPGLFGPLSILVFGVMLLRTGALPAWAGLMLCVGAISFPMGRIPRVPEIALATDALLLVPLVVLGLRQWNSRRVVAT